MEFKKTTIKNKQDFKAFGQKRSKAQHLVEFVLFFPFLVGIIALPTTPLTKTYQKKYKTTLEKFSPQEKFRTPTQ